MSDYSIVNGFVLMLVILAARKGYAAWKERRNLQDSSSFLENVRFDTSGWQPHETERWSWLSDQGDALTVAHSPAPPDVSASDGAETIRAYCRQLAEDNGGWLVSAEPRPCGGAEAVACIYKRELKPGYAYTGVLLMRAVHGQVGLSVSSMERGTTGARDALAAAMLAEEGKLSLRTDARGRMEGWFRDPYDRHFDADTIVSVADDERFDGRLPHDPLTTVRRTLRTIEQTISMP